MFKTFKQGMSNVQKNKSMQVNFQTSHVQKENVKCIHKKKEKFKIPAVHCFNRHTYFLLYKYLVSTRRREMI